MRTLSPVLLAASLVCVCAAQDAHAIMGGGIRDVDPAMFARIRDAYDSAMAAIRRVFTTHHIPMDVFHGKRIRPVVCGDSGREQVGRH